MEPILFSLSDLLHDLQQLIHLPHSRIMCLSLITLLYA